ncbi:MAG TPA: IS630 family transposase [Lacipirellulaceae bacterium]
MEKRYRVTLTAAERGDLQKLVSVGKSAAQKLVRARILLLADQADGGPAKSDPEIVDALGCSRASVERIRKRFVEEGLEASLCPKPSQRVFERKLDGKAEAHLIALACGAPPEGRSRWTLRLLSDQMVVLEHVESLSHETVRRALKKNELKPWLKKGWCLPEGPSAEFVAAMEDVLEVYQRPYDAERPMVCMDECSKQLIGEVREPLPPKPGQVAKEDSEYERKGTANVFMAVEPLAGQRTTQVTERRTRVDWAHFVQMLLLTVYPLAKKVVLVMDNLNTHGIASLYEAFAPEVALALANRLEIHYTPKHGSWLNMAETELSVLSRQCLDRRIDDRDLMAREVAAWQTARNAATATINWQFQTADARIKLKRLYPSFGV